jgi:fatty acid desaturase
VTIVEIPPIRQKIEWPTVLLGFVIYGLWFLTTYFYASLPWWALTALGAWTVAWHLNFQHETIHGHPTRVRAVNFAFGCWPLALWLPYEIYRRSHLDHHRDARLTDPLDDPESYYWSEGQWRSIGAIGRVLVRAQTTLLGRLIIGPAWMILRFDLGFLKAALKGEGDTRRVLALHLLEVAVVLVWIIGVCRMPLWIYLVCFIYPGMSLALVRSFAEHRAAPDSEKRTAIVEDSWILGPLFLFNNLHVAHHLRGGIPWYQLPRFYRLNRQALIEHNGGLVYAGYFDVARRYFLRAHDAPLHPYFGRPAA